MKIDIVEDEYYPYWSIAKRPRSWSVSVEVSEKELEQIKRNLRAGERAQKRLHELAREAGWF